MKKKIFLLLLLTLGLTACGGAQPTSTAGVDVAKTNRAESFIYAIDADPISINPITASDRYGLTTVNMVFQPLARIGVDGEIVNELADDIQWSADGLTLTVTLKDDLKWSDGEPLTADDVVFTYKHRADKANGNSDNLWIEGQPVKFEKVDEKTINFRLPAVSTSALEAVLTEKYIMPKHIYQDLKDFSDQRLEGREVIGSGPYKLVAYKPGQYLHFTRNENYNGEPAKIKEMVFQIIANADTKKVALQNGDVDAAVVRPQDRQEFDEETFNTQPYSENRVGYIGFNMKRPGLKNQKFRQALMYALNREDLNKVAYQDEKLYTNAPTFLPPKTPYFSPDAFHYEHDAKKARALLQEAGQGDTTLALGFDADDPVQRNVTALIQQQLQDVGVKVKLQPADPSALSAATQDPDKSPYDLFLNGYIMGIHPNLYRTLFTSDGFSNYFGFQDPEIDRLFDEGAKEPDEEKGKAIYKELQGKLNEKAGIYPMVDNKKIFVSHKRVSGFKEAKFVPIYTLEHFDKLELQKP